MNSAQQQNSNLNFYQTIDQTVANIRPTVVPLYSRDEGAKIAGTGFGSAFIVLVEHQLYLVTAMHVLIEWHELIRLNKLVVGFINDKPCAMHKLEFLTSEEFDLAVALLSDAWLDEANISGIRAIPLLDDVQGTSTELYLAMGCPSSKNIIRPEYNKHNRTVHSLTVSPAPPPEASRIPHGLGFEYDPKRSVNSEGKNLGGHVDLHGMSGGPVFELVFSARLGGTVPMLSGVLCEWHEKDRKIVASPLEAMLVLIAHFRAPPQ
ncbi:hypothetical protein [uncultured Herbaspirillum sp.]|uniref:hypothetical protein n=1 Tax=uncultured Herbaspirillum sp. TaxID=160236 RepID=UPI002585DF2B|nr:hypothetical protein [uncultured Herbaspirillum sp.]